MNDADVIFEWTVHPFVDDPKRRLIFLSTVSATLILVWFSFQNLAWAIFSLVFLLAALNAFILPTRYRLSKTELEVYRLRVIRHQQLSDIRRLDCARNGFFLSPFRRPSRMENYRGVFLPYPPNVDQVREFLETHIRGTEHVQKPAGDNGS